MIRDFLIGLASAIAAVILLGFLFLIVPLIMAVAGLALLVVLPVPVDPAYAPVAALPILAYLYILAVVALG